MEKGGLTSTGVPCDVAVHQPCARVVGLEGDRDVPVRREQHDVPPGRVVEIECGEAGGRVERRVALGQEHNVHAVPVEGMCNFCRMLILSILQLFVDVFLADLRVYILGMMLVFTGRGIVVSFEDSMIIKT